MHGIKDLVGNLSLLFCWCTSEITEINIKEIINFVMFFPVFWTYFLTCQIFLNCFDFGSSSLLICSADLNSILPHKSALTLVYICWEHASDNIAQVRYIVNVGECWGDHNVPFSRSQGIFFSLETHQSSVRFVFAFKHWRQFHCFFFLLKLFIFGISFLLFLMFLLCFGVFNKFILFSFNFYTF